MASDKSRQRRTALVLFGILFAASQPPVVHSFANRTEPWFLGMPFLYAYLLLVYSLQIAILIRAYRKGL